MPIDQIALALYITLVSGVLATVVARSISGLRAEMREEISALKTELRGEISALKTELRGEIYGVKGEIVGLRQEMAIMRSDLTRVALAVGVEPREASGG